MTHRSAGSTTWESAEIIVGGVVVSLVTPLLRRALGPAWAPVSLAIIRYRHPLRYAGVKRATERPRDARSYPQIPSPFEGEG